eukprot:gnl/MRDRNA2_/MRDRNA2_172122_c0_seq1.p1 gnl/MRDRNA2_/MRDRNA2_172122_c0~~gnl/MRDRNA2_/MRDRNA2_172122_c0_seq1.p1  ORF type:complete len:319 (-),score=59.18 gnl/MRDRNA2_/MRDRNA2_172122_c0_seq1:66-1022(-)
MTSEHPLSSSVDMSLPGQCISSGTLSMFEIPTSGESSSEAKLGREKISAQQKQSEVKKTHCTCDYCISQNEREALPKKHTSVKRSESPQTPSFRFNHGSKSPGSQSKTWNNKKQKKSSNRTRSFSMVLLPDPDESALRNEQKEQEDLLHQCSIFESVLPPRGTELELKDLHPHNAEVIAKVKISDDEVSTTVGSKSTTSSPAPASLMPRFSAGESDSDEDSSDLLDILDLKTNVDHSSICQLQEAPISHIVVQDQAHECRLDGHMSLKARIWKWWAQRIEVCWIRNLEEIQGLVVADASSFHHGADGSNAHAMKLSVP